MKVVWSNEAKIALTDIYNYIFQDSPKNADMVLDTLLALGNSLSDKRFDFAKDPIVNKKNIRFIPKWNYKIIYERTDEKVIILDIFNASQNPDKMHL